MLLTLGRVGNALCAKQDIRVTTNPYAHICQSAPSSSSQMLMGDIRLAPSTITARCVSAVLTPSPIRRTRVLAQNQRGSVVRTVLLPNVSPTVTCCVSPLRSPQQEVPGAEGGVEDRVVGEVGDMVAEMEELVEAVGPVTNLLPMVMEAVVTPCLIVNPANLRGRAILVPESTAMVTILLL